MTVFLLTRDLTVLSRNGKLRASVFSRTPMVNQALRDSAVLTGNGQTENLSGMSKRDS